MLGDSGCRDKVLCCFTKIMTASSENRSRNRFTGRDESGKQNATKEKRQNYLKCAVRGSGEFWDNKNVCNL